MISLLLALQSLVHTEISLEYSGKVLEINGAPKSGVVVTLSRTGVTTATDDFGAWKFFVDNTGIQPSKRKSSRIIHSSHLYIKGGCIQVNINGNDIAGKRIRNANFENAEQIGGYRRASNSVDTLIYSINGRIFLRDTISNPKQSIVAVFDSTWNPSIIYGFILDERDGERYRIVKIGAQTWMAQNLNFVNDSSWWYVGGNGHTGDSVNETQTKGSNYGRLYKWASAMALPNSCNFTNCSTSINSKHQGACPIGWHIPNSSEWDTLFSAAGGDLNAAAALASNNLLYYKGADSYGFRAVPAGLRTIKGGFGYAGGDTHWWCNKEAEIGWAYENSIDFFSSRIYRYSIDKNAGLSVRCIKN